MFLITGVAVGDTTSKISTASIGIEVELIGKSGLPLGTVFSVEGMVVVEKSKHHKEGDRKFIMFRKINGDLLKSPMKMSLWGEHGAKKGVWTELTVIEDAQYSLLFTPNLSVDDTKNDKGRQTL